MTWGFVAKAGITIGAAAVSSYIGSKGAKDAASTESEAIMYQTEVQDRAARDFMATSIDWTKEQRDISLTGTESNRNAGALALAGMMDMTGMNRFSLPGSPARGAPPAEGELTGGTEGVVGFDPSSGKPIFQHPGGSYFIQGDDGQKIAINAPGTGDNEAGAENTHGQFVSDEQRGTSLYSPEVEYDLDRLHDPNRIMTESEAFNWRKDPGYEFRLDETMRGMERSFNAQSGTKSGAYDRALMETAGNFASAEYGNVFSRLSTIAGYGPGAAPHGATSDGGIGQGAQGVYNAASGISAAGSARAQGQVASANAWATGINQMATGLGGLI